MGSNSKLNRHKRSILIAVASLSLNTAIVPADWYSDCDSCVPAATTNPASSNPAPADDEPESQPAATFVNPRPAVFAAPAASGEVAGGRKSLGLPSLRITMPRITLETPEFRFNGFTQYRRDAHMQIDSANAPVSHMDPAIYGNLVGASIGANATQSTPSSSNNAGSTPAGNDTKSTPAASTPQVPCYQYPNCDGCVQNSNTKQVQELASQVQQLQGVIAQLIQAQQQLAQANTPAPPAQPQPPMGIPTASVTQASRNAMLAEQQEAMRQAAIAQVNAEHRRQLEDEYVNSIREMERLQARMQQIQSAYDNLQPAAPNLDVSGVYQPSHSSQTIQQTGGTVPVDMTQPKTFEQPTFAPARPPVAPSTVEVSAGFSELFDEIRPDF